MAEYQGKKEEEKFEFDSAGEALGYISLDQARVLAMGTARETPGAYGRRFRNVPMAFEVVEDNETEDHYMVTLSFRPQGQFTGAPGQEQFFIEKEGAVAHRQVLGLPASGRGRRIPVVRISIGLVVLVIAAWAYVVFVGDRSGNGGGDDNQNAGLAPAATPAPTSIPPTATAAPVALIAPPVPTNAPPPTPTPANTSTPEPTRPPIPTATPTPVLPPANTLTPTSVPKPTTDPAAIAEFLSQPWVQGIPGTSNTASNPAILSMALSSDHVTIFATIQIGNNKSLFRSADGGRTWRGVASELEAYSLVFEPGNPQIVYANNGTWRSEDGGISWIQSPSVPGQPFIAYPDVLYAGGYLSQDKGETWRLVIEDVRYKLIPSGASLALFAVVQGVGDSRNYFVKSTDGGSTWDSVTLPKELDGTFNNHYDLLDFFFIDFSDPPNVFIGKVDGALFKANALKPTKWEKVPWPSGVNSVNWFAAHPTNPAVLAMVSNASTFVTFNSGGSWVELPKPEHMEGNVIREIGVGGASNGNKLVITGAVDSQVCVGTLLGVWCHSLSIN